jgi:hypothetical protein
VDNHIAAGSKPGQTFIKNLHPEFLPHFLK